MDRKERRKMRTKGFMIKELKKRGVRKGPKNNSEVKLEHLKTFAVIKLYDEHVRNDV
jgi:hypothetical protein